MTRRNLSSLLLLLAVSVPALAQEDNTGTNPVNFTYDLRFIAEAADLPDSGGSSLTSTVELRWPLGRNVANLQGKSDGFFNDLGQKFGMRIRARYKRLSLNTPGVPPFDTTEVSGIGDFDARLLYIAYTSPGLIVAGGLEAFFDTASNDAVGSGKTSLGPQIFTVFPGLLGPGSLFAPGYQYVFDIAGDDARPDIGRSQLDLYFVWILAQGKNWLIVDPQAVVDHENDKELATVEAEWGFMIAPSIGASAYLRPGVGIGSDKPYSWNLEAAIKFVWR